MTDRAHAALMDRIYRHQRHIYDATRAVCLPGRDRLIRELDPPEHGSVLEIACGTGRNLSRIGASYPTTHLFGLDISEQMLRTARAKLGVRAQLAQGDARGFDPLALFGQPDFDRVLLSYGVSMIPDWPQALAAALAACRPGGSVHLVDFGAATALPGWVEAARDRVLARFHVTPRAELDAVVQRAAGDQDRPAVITQLCRGYARYAVLGPQR